MTITLYDYVSSPNCQRVEIVLHEKGLPYDIVPISLRKKEQKKPEFLKLNPYGKVPVIVDGEKVLFESCIINEYLDEQYPNPPLMPKDPYKRARIRLLIDYGLNYIHVPYRAIRGELYLKKEEGERDRRLIEETTRQLIGLLQYLDDEIGEKDYFMEVSAPGIVRRYACPFFPAARGVASEDERTTVSKGKLVDSVLKTKLEEALSVMGALTFRCFQDSRQYKGVDRWKLSSV